jgi:hypothetical protein
MARRRVWQVFANLAPWATWFTENTITLAGGAATRGGLTHARLLQAGLAVAVMGCQVAGRADLQDGDGLIRPALPG